MAYMRKATFTITVPHLFSPIFAYSAKSKSYVIALRFNVTGNDSNKSIEFLGFP